MLLWKGMIRIGEMELPGTVYYSDPASDKPITWLGTARVMGSLPAESLTLKMHTNIGILLVTGFGTDPAIPEVQFAGYGLPQGPLAAAMGLE
jgi:hypothetical protein